MSSTTRSGDIAEMSFALRAKQKKFAVLTPFSNSSAYDLVLDTGKRLLKIQVKSTIQEKSKTSFKVNISRGFKKQYSYKENEVDYFAIYIVKIDKFFIIPFSEITKISVYLSPENENHKYTKYLENWEQLNE
tara:strand:- start:26404 stop:26799 length:396 start_codon:yes stop_codon:yes gene_type:complete